MWVGASFGCLGWLCGNDDVMMKHLGGAERRAQANKPCRIHAEAPSMHALEICGVCVANACLEAPQNGRLVRKPPLPPFGQLVPCPGASRLLLLAHGPSQNLPRFRGRGAFVDTQPLRHRGLACRPMLLSWYCSFSGTCVEIDGGDGEISSTSSLALSLWPCPWYLVLIFTKSLNGRFTNCVLKCRIKHLDHAAFQIFTKGDFPTTFLWVPYGGDKKKTGKGTDADNTKGKNMKEKQELKLIY